MGAMLSPEEPVAVAVVAAIVGGDVPALKRLLDEHRGLAGERIGDDACSRTLLHVATDWPGHRPAVATTIGVLGSGGADPNARFAGTSHAETPLHWAASSDDVEALDALLDLGADLDADGGVMDGGTPLADARIFAQWNAARRLIERGATTTLDDEAAFGLLDRIEARFDDPAARPPSETVDQAFWYACHGGQRAAAEYLLEAGADLNRIAPWERLTPLDAAVRSSEQNGTHAEALIDWLRSAGATSAR